MADIRINALPTTASASSSDDYIALDGTTNGTRKLNAYSPTFGGNLTVSGAGTSSFASNINVNKSTAVVDIGDGTTGPNFRLVSSVTGDANAYLQIGKSSADTNANLIISRYATGSTAINSASIYATTTLLSGNLTVSGTGVSTFSSEIAANKSGSNISFPALGSTAKSGLWTNADGTMTWGDYATGTKSLKLNTTTGNATLAGNLTVSGTGNNVFRGPIRWGNTAYPGYNGYITETNTDSQLIPAITRNLIGTTGNTQYTIANAELGAYAAFELGTNIRWFAGSGTFTTGQTITPTELMRLTQGGNLLLGTTIDTGEKLQVNGTGYFAGALLQLGNGTVDAIYRVTASNGKSSDFGDDTTGGFVRANNSQSLRFITAGNIVLTLDSSANATFAGKVTPTGGIVGVTTNSNAAAGIVGEYVSSTVGAGSAITLTTATAANLTSITLTPGDWDVVFVPHFWGDGSSVTGTQCVSSLSTTSATLDTTPNRLAQFPSVPTSAADLTVAIPATRFSVTSSTIIYGVVRSTFTVGTNKVYGALSARRVR